MARSSAGGVAVWLVARWVPSAIPGRLFIDSELVVLRHPVPTEQVHLLVLPRRRLADAHDQGDDVGRFWTSLGEWVLGRASARGVCAGVTNVGSRQDVPLLHVHLIGRRPAWIEASTEPAASADRLADAVRICVGRADVRTRLAAGGSYGFEIAVAGSRWSVWAQSAGDTAV